MGPNDLMLLDERIKARRQQVAPNMSESEFFDLFVAEQVLKNFQPSLDGLRYGLVDGEGDCGIDGFYCFINDQQLFPGMELKNLGRNPRIDCVITQCKTSQGFSEQVIEKLDFHLPQLLRFDRDEALLAQFTHERLLELTRLFLAACSALIPQNPAISFYLGYATRADEVHPNVVAKSQMVCQTMRSLFPGCSCPDFKFLRAADLLDFAQKGAETSRWLPIAEGPLSSEAVKGEGYVCLVRLQDYYDFIVEETGALNAGLF